MIINLLNTKTVTLQEAKIKTINTITVNRMVDIPTQKIVRVFIEELPEPVTLWEGAAYDAIGQWSDTDVTNRLNELYNAPLG
jgi:hypothetical protein